MGALVPLTYDGEIVRERASFVSMTDMWRAARERHVRRGGKAEDFESRRPTDWLALTSTQDFIAAVEASFNAGKSGIDTVRGGRAPGTWAHWQIGIAYAKYLDHEFHMWANTAVRDRMEGTAATSNSPASVKVVASALRLFMLAQRVARSGGFDKNQASILANRATVSTTGVDAHALLGITHLIAPQQERLLTPTQIGSELGGESARSINLLLQRHGFQTGPDWEPTDKGRPYGVFLDTTKKQGDGTPIRQLKWSADILPTLQAAVAQVEVTHDR